MPCYPRPCASQSSTACAIVDLLASQIAEQGNGNESGEFIVRLHGPERLPVKRNARSLCPVAAKYSE